MDLANSARDVWWSEAVADAPTSYRIGFRHRINNHCSVAHAVDLGHRDVLNFGADAWIENVFVDLVSETKRVKLLAESGDEFHFVTGENFSRRIIWVANNDCLGVFVES